MTYKRLRYLRFQFFFYAALQATLRLILLLSSWGLVSASPLDLARVTWYQGASYLYRSGLLKGAAAQRAVK